MFLYSSCSSISNSSTLFLKNYLPHYSEKSTKYVLLQQENKLFTIRTNPSSKSSLTGQTDKFIIPHRYLSNLVACSRLPKSAAIVKSPHAVRKSSSLDSTPWIPDFTYWIPDALSLELGLWIPIVGEITDSLSSIPDSKAQDSGFQLDRQKFSGFLYMG